MKKTTLAAVFVMAGSGMAHAGPDMVHMGVTVVSTTAITVPSASADVGVPAVGGVPVFVVATPPVAPGSPFTFRLVRPDH